MHRRLLPVLAVLALAVASLLAVAEAAPGGESLPASGPGALVAVVDSGVDRTAAALAGRVLPGADLVEPGDGTRDPSGHGTAVAAAVLARCPNCTIVPVRVLSARGAAPWSRVAAGIVRAVDLGARVVNVSVAGPAGSAALRAAVAYAAERDVVVVAAAGNAGSTRPAYPAAYPGVVGVAASSSTGLLHDWSSRGRWIDLAAPGCNRLPVAGRRAWACGTSFAAPLVAATAALARAAHPDAAAAEVAAALPAQVSTRQESPAVTVTGIPQPGAVLRASVRTLGPDTALRWFRCGRLGCTPVGAGATYRVDSEDTGASLVARVVTESFGELWLAASEPLAV